MHFNIGGNLNYFTTLKYKKNRPRTKNYEIYFLHTGVDHSCRVYQYLYRGSIKIQFQNVLEKVSDIIFEKYRYQYRILFEMYL